MDYQAAYETARDLMRAAGEALYVAQQTNSPDVETLASQYADALQIGGF